MQHNAFTFFQHIFQRYVVNVCDTRIDIQTQFCVSFITLWWQNRSFQTLQSCQFLKRSLFRFSPMFMNHG